MKYTLLFLLIGCQLSLQAQDSLTTADVQGTWKLTAERIEKSPLIEEDVMYTPGFRWNYPELNWVIRGNKIYEIDYPCCLKKTYTFKTLKNGLLIKESRGDGFEESAALLTFTTDSMTLEDGVYTSHTTYFRKDTLPEKEVDQLIRGTINPACLYGDWEIPVGEVSVPYDAIRIWYPFQLPDTLHINAKNINQYFADNEFYLKVDGVKRSFKVTGVSVHDDNLTLIPDHWVDKYMKEQELDKSQLEYVWLRRVVREE